MTRRLTVVGGLLAAAYLATAALTLHLGPRPLRPLFDGFAPPAPYNWVNPPREFAAGNQRPTGSASSFDVLADGSEATGTGTPDGQALVTLPAGAVPPQAQAGAAQAELRLEPIDAGTLAPLPDGLQAHSNAYHVTVTYQPSGSPVTEFAKPGTVALTAATNAAVLLFSADGRAWKTVPSQAFGQSPGLTGALAAPGYLVVAGSAGGAGSSGSSGSSSTNVGLIVAIVVVAVAAVAGAVVVIVRRRGRG